MTEKEILARLKALEARVDALDGGQKERGPARAPASKRDFVKREENQFPKWVYAIVDGELKSALIEREEDMPEVAYESPEEAQAAGTRPAEPDASAPAPEPEKEPDPEKEDEPTEVEIPEGWQEMHHSTRIKLAKSLPGGDDIVAADDADALIELELERRGNT